MCVCVCVCACAKKACFGTQTSSLPILDFVASGTVPDCRPCSWGGRRELHRRCRRHGQRADMRRRQMPRTVAHGAGESTDAHSSRAAAMQRNNCLRHHGRSSSCVIGTQCPRFSQKEPAQPRPLVGAQAWSRLLTVLGKPARVFQLPWVCACFAGWLVARVQLCLRAVMMYTSRS